MKREIILASKSPRRKEILQMLGLPFRVQDSGAEENAPEGLTPAELVVVLAEQKREAVREKVPTNAVVIAADTVVCCEGKIMGKPADLEEAAAMLHSLSGRMHTVHTGIAVSAEGKTASDSVETRVYFRQLEEKEIEYYLHHAQVCDKAGAYAIQEYAGAFVNRIDGDYYSVVGLSVNVLDRLLKEIGCPLLELTETGDSNA